MSNPLSEAQFGPGSQLPLLMTPEEVGNLTSGDFWPEKVKNTYGNMLRDEHNYEDPDYRHVDAGGTDEYLDGLQQSIEENKGIEEPAFVGLPHPAYKDEWGNNRLDRPSTTLLDGHHRSVIAMRTNRLLPVIFAPERRGTPK